MNEMPEMSDYVTLIFTLFEQFEQQQMQNGKIKQGRPYTFDQQCFLILFVIFQFRRISQFKTQARWLRKHPEVMEMLNFAGTFVGTLFSWEQFIWITAVKQ